MKQIFVGSLEFTYEDFMTIPQGRRYCLIHEIDTWVPFNGE